MSGMRLMVSDSHGVYVPKVFAQSFSPEKWQFRDGDADWETCSMGPDTDWYWESWEWILQRAVHKDSEGNVWTLHQDGDLWAVCVELMTDEEYEGYFGESRQNVA